MSWLGLLVAPGLRLDLAEPGRSGCFVPWKVDHSLSVTAANDTCTEVACHANTGPPRRQISVWHGGPPGLSARPCTSSGVEEQDRSMNTAVLSLRDQDASKTYSLRPLLFTQSPSKESIRRVRIWLPAQSAEISVSGRIGPSLTPPRIVSASCHMPMHSRFSSMTEQI